MLLSNINGNDSTNLWSSFERSARNATVDWRIWSAYRTSKSARWDSVSLPLRERAPCCRHCNPPDAIERKKQRPSARMFTKEKPLWWWPPETLWLCWLGLATFPSLPSATSTSCDLYHKQVWHYRWMVYPYNTNSIQCGPKRKLHQNLFAITLANMDRVLIIFSLLHSQMKCRKSWYKIYHLTQNVLPHYLEWNVQLLSYFHCILARMTYTSDNNNV